MAVTMLTIDLLQRVVPALTNSSHSHSLCTAMPVLLVSHSVLKGSVCLGHFEMHIM